MYCKTRYETWIPFFLNAKSGENQGRKRIKFCQVMNAQVPIDNKSKIFKFGLSLTQAYK